jgi:hypothetical protein
MNRIIRNKKKIAISIAVIVVLYVLTFIVFFTTIKSQITHDYPARTPKIVIFGDTRTNHAEHRKIIKMMRDEKPSVVFNTGDLMTHGWSMFSWYFYHTIEKDLINEAEYFPAMGNHEHHSWFYYYYFDLPGKENYYSVNRYGIHFVVLDSNLGGKKFKPQAKWLEKDLEKNKNAPFIFLVFHHPLYSTMKIEDEKHIKEYIEPLLVKYDVPAVFNAHLHSYERSEVRGVQHIITAGGGAPLRKPIRHNDYSKVYVHDYNYTTMEFQGQNLAYKAYDYNRNVIDSLVFTPRKESM